jgi:hypothetical protein
LSDAEASHHRGGAAILAFPPAAANQVAFDGRELRAILKVYGRMVAAGEWRDYAIDMLKDRAVFSVFRRTSEMPLFSIEKTPRNARRQGAYSVVAAGGRILKRGHELDNVLRVLEPPRPRLVSV